MPTFFTEYQLAVMNVIDQDHAWTLGDIFNRLPAAQRDGIEVARALEALVAAGYIEFTPAARYILLHR